MSDIENDVPRNFLDHGQVCGVLRWLEKHAAELDGMTRAKIAEKATEALSFCVTEANVRAMCLALEKNGVAAPRPTRDGMSATSAAKQGKNYFIAHALRDLLVELGHPVPEYLQMCCVSEFTLEEIAEVFLKSPST